MILHSTSSTARLHPPIRVVPRILAVDDQSANLMALEGVFEPLDVELTCVTSGAEALGRILENNYDLVLLDVQMPDMNGFETAQLIHNSRRTRHVPIIFITALSTDYRFVRKGYELGAVDYITKPIDPSILRSKVEVFLQLHKSNDRLRTELSELKSLEKHLIESNESLRHQAETDSLTGLLNRRRGYELLCKEMSRVVRGNQDVSLFMLDVDFFKNINDNYGHQSGDMVLVEISKRLIDCCRMHDMVVRWGGEEFLIICPHTGFQQAASLAERMRAAISQHPISIIDGAQTMVTVSLGTASTDMLPGMSVEALIAQADDALYMAKHDGRNCIRSAQI